jgi:hypothetical protein
MPHAAHFGMTVTSDPAPRTITVAPSASTAVRRPVAADRSTARRVIIVDSPVPSYSSESPTLLLADHLARRGAGVDVLTGVDVLPDVTPSGKIRFDGLPPSPRTRPDAACTTAEPHAPHLVIGMSAPDGDARAAARLARRTGARLLVVVTGLELPVPQHVVDVLATADRITVPGESFRRALTALGIDDARITVLPTWSHSAPSWLDRTDARRRLGWPERAFIAVHSGPMSADSGLESVVRAGGLAGSDCIVAVTGSGPLRATVAALAAQVPNVLVTEPMDAEQRALTHVAADVLLVTEPSTPSRLVPPLELACCLSAGRPVVAAAPARGCLSTELERTAGAGFVVPPDQPAELAEALLAMRADPSHRVAMGLAAISYAESRLSRDVVLSRFDLVVEAALAGADDRAEQQG